MILKRKVSNLDNHIVPTKTGSTDSSHSQKETSVGNEENEENDPEEKGE